MKAHALINVLNHVHPDSEVTAAGITSPEGAHTVTFEEAQANIAAGRFVWDSTPKAKPAEAGHASTIAGRPSRK